MLSSRTIRSFAFVVCTGLVAAGCSESADIATSTDSAAVTDRVEPADVTNAIIPADLGSGSGTIEVHWSSTLMPDELQYAFFGDEVGVALHFDGDDYELVTLTGLFTGGSSRFVDGRFFARSPGLPNEEQWEEATGLEAPEFSELAESDVRAGFELQRDIAGGVDPQISEDEIVDHLDGFGATWERDGEFLIGVMSGERLRTLNADEVPMGFSFLVADPGRRELIPDEVEFEVEVVDGFVSSVKLQIAGTAPAGPVDAEVVARLGALEEPIEIPDTSASERFQESIEQHLAEVIGDPLEGLSEAEKIEFEGLMGGRELCQLELSRMVFDRTLATIEDVGDCFTKEGEERLAELVALVEPQ